MVKLGNILFAVSKTCNLKCSYCYVSKTYKNSPVDNEGVYQSFVRFVKKLKDEDTTVDKIIFHGAEPTMLSVKTYQKMIAHFYTFFQRKNDEKSPRFTLQTNGVNLHDFIENLDPLDVRLSVSLDGFEAHNDAFRGKGVFKKVVENLKKAKNKGFYVSVLSVLSKPLMEEKEALVEFIQELKDIGIKVYLKAIHTEDKHLSVHNDSGYAFGKWMVEKKMQSHLQFYTPELCCNLGNNCFFVEFDIDGKVYSCNKSYLVQGEFAQWHQESFQEIIKKRLTLFHKNKVNNDCFSCLYLTRCFSGCPSDRVDGKSVDCFIRRGVFESEHCLKSLGE